MLDVQTPYRPTCRGDDRNTIVGFPDLLEQRELCVGCTGPRGADRNTIVGFPDLLEQRELCVGCTGPRGADRNTIVGFPDPSLQTKRTKYPPTIKSSSEATKQTKLKVFIVGQARCLQSWKATDLQSRPAQVYAILDGYGS